jgi:hypothetical protein
MVTETMFEALFGTPAYQLVRSDAPETSKEAAYGVDTSYLEELVYDTIKGFGHDGCISDEVRRIHPTFPYSSITARYAALSRKGLISFKSEKRKGESGRSQRIMVAN